jgi:ParB family chromosome partitioning protein
MSRDILLALIDADPDQPRKHFDKTQLDELAQSMAANGLAVSILVRPAGERYTIVHGERRYRAALSLGWETIAADVRDVAPDEAPWLALIENIQRADLSPIEEARAYRARLDTGITQQALGERIGKSQSHIATRLRYLKLEPEMQEALHTGVITEGHAKQLLRIEHSDQRHDLFHSTRDMRLSVKRLAEAVDALDTHMAEDQQHLELLEQLDSRREAANTAAAEAISDVASAFQYVAANLTPEQFDQWATDEMKMGSETAKEFAAFNGSLDTGMTDRLQEFFANFGTWRIRYMSQPHHHTSAREIVARWKTEERTAS